MILACRQLHKAYGIDVILEKITFHIEEREKAAIVGVNGAGKTTLFKVLTGEISQEGRIPGLPCSEYSDRQRPHDL